MGKAVQSLIVKQSTTTGIIDWNSFSVGKRDIVTFDNGNGATLNRVTGGDLSRIAGSLHASGSLYLMNARGVIISGTGHIVTGGSFVVSSGNIAGNAFGSDELRLRGAHAAIVNRGSIVSSGEASLVGGSVKNTGTITASSVDLRAMHGGAVGGGTVAATGSASQGGHILLIAVNGKTKVTGKLMARNQDGSGGSIETSGKHLSIVGHIDAGQGGSWLVDPINLTIDAAAAATIDTSLNAGTNVTLKTTATGSSGPGKPSSGTGNIIIAAALSWSSKATLELDAFHSILIEAPVDVTKNGGITLITSDGGTSGSVAFEKGNIAFGELSDRLAIDGTVYTLESNIKTLATAIAARPTGNFALANSYNAAGDGTYKSSPIAKAFSGTFLGLGNTISNLSINAGSGTSIGLFSSIAASGVVEDLSLAAVNIVGGTDVGSLAGANTGTLKDDFVAGQLNGVSNVGGLVGTNAGKIDGDSSSVSVVDTHGTQQPGLTGSLVGDLVGFNEVRGLVEDSSATGSVVAVDSSDVGGIAGRNSGTLENSYATGAIQAFNAGGGLVGNNEAIVEDSWASGHVQGMRYIGGLIGFSDADNAVAEDSYATGTVVADAGGEDEGGLVGRLAGTAKVTDCYATGIVTGNDYAGGLVGLNDAIISSSYATGAVSGAKYVGGLVGSNTVSGSDIGTIGSSYSTGAVKGKKYVGGVAGSDAGSFSSVYWDTQTSGTALGVGLQEAGAHGSPVGRTTAQLTASLPAGFASSVWAIDPKLNNGFPYLIALASSY